MLSPQVIVKGIVSRFLPAPQGDGTENEKQVRMGRYGDLRVESAWPSDHLLADEGAYMVASALPGAASMQNGINATFVNTLASYVLGNSDSAGGKRLYPKALRMSVVTAPTSGVDLRYAIVLDSKDRTPSTISSGTGGSGPGTAANNTGYRAPVACTNMDVNPTIVGVPYFTIGLAASTGPMTVPTPGQYARTLVGNGTIKASIPVAKDQYVIQFGGADVGGTFQGAAAIAKIVEHAPAVVVGPGQFLLIYIWSLSNVTAGIAFDDVGLSWIEK